MCRSLTSRRIRPLLSLSLSWPLIRTSRCPCRSARTLASGLGSDLSDDAGAGRRHPGQPFSDRPPTADPRSLPQRLFGLAIPFSPSLFDKSCWQGVTVSNLSGDIVRSRERESLGLCPPQPQQGSRRHRDITILRAPIHALSLTASRAACQSTAARPTDALLLPLPSALSPSLLFATRLV